MLSTTSNHGDWGYRCTELNSFDSLMGSASGDIGPYADHPFGPFSILLLHLTKSNMELPIFDLQRYESMYVVKKHHITGIVSSDKIPSAESHVSFLPEYFPCLEWCGSGDPESRTFTIIALLAAQIMPSILVLLGFVFIQLRALPHLLCFFCRLRCHRSAAAKAPFALHRVNDWK
ncbi:hypothetical protein NA56DRAFT_745365 [Hyaloscypha hepaticicola]|uniref:Uncharacterized protein n=1 Tax=Hyaloscypha hepaticicola TaxID=2082293 RepID=A0A2J6QH66_9HELO|nr:hypothetical protein NA56DRAFT_745365 [Hyaloscypha hepaticicola]